jgi:Protein of unknown function (DUF2946)
MDFSFRKFIAILMLVWFPLVSSSALAAEVSIDMGDTCDSMAIPVLQHQQSGGNDRAVISHDQNAVPCNNCCVCQLVCYGFLATPSLEQVSLQLDGQLITPSLVSFASRTSAPLDHPPLA